jgi:hypothetical protein
MAQVWRLKATNEDQTVEILMAIGGELGVRHAGSVADDRGALSFVRKLPALEQYGVKNQLKMLIYTP